MLQLGAAGLLYMLAVLGGFGVLGLLHYVVWGRHEERTIPLRRNAPPTRPWNDRPPTVP